MQLTSKRKSEDRKRSSSPDLVIAEN